MATDLRTSILVGQRGNKSHSKQCDISRCLAEIFACLMVVALKLKRTVKGKMQHGKGKKPQANCVEEGPNPIESSKEPGEKGSS
ncbi:hypothetical protein COLO4_36386 [Corchorus olitorius]|uniref:Uncharacterized protein n=1 Tax=Corchorus olitorius TaxID=93759 RepID=A0A1R3G987_9ROSI|nr:hypothetical protein COLO4_36386 [Corchorus olitorius]